MTLKIYRERRVSKMLLPQLRRNSILTSLSPGSEGKLYVS